MFDPAVLKIVFTGKAKSVFPTSGIGNNGFYNFRGFLRNPFISIYHQNPGFAAFIYGRLLLGPESQPGLVVNFATKPGGKYTVNAALQ